MIPPYASEEEQGQDGRVPSAPGSREPDPQAVPALSGFDPSRGVIHLRNGRAQRHPQTRGDGKTWCGKKLLGEAVLSENGVFTYSSYGSDVLATLDPDYGTCERCSAAFDAAYAAAFPEGPKPIATFRADNPADVERAKNLLSAEAMNRFFGPGGGGMEAFAAALRDSDGSGEAGETAKQGSTEGDSTAPSGDRP